MKILIVAPEQAGVSNKEIPVVASGNRPTILSGLITMDHLAAVLSSQQFQVIHFMQHGTYGVLRMSDGLMNEDQLVRMLSKQRDVQLIFCNACNSAGLAARLHNELRCATVAHEAPINDDLALVYAREFYRALTGCFDLHAAHEAAFAALETEAKAMGQTDYVKPILTNGDMVTLQQLGAAVTRLQAEQAEMQRTLHELVRWVRVVVPTALGIMATLVGLAYLAPR